MPVPRMSFRRGLHHKYTLRASARHTPPLPPRPARCSALYEPIQYEDFAVPGTQSHILGCVRDWTQPSCLLSPQRRITFSPSPDDRQLFILFLFFVSHLYSSSASYHYNRAEQLSF